MEISESMQDQAITLVLDGRLCLERQILTGAQLDQILNPFEMTEIREKKVLE